MVFLHLPPDHIGYMENEPFHMVFVRYLGKACPIIAPMVGRYFGRNRKRLESMFSLVYNSLPGLSAVDLSTGSLGLLTTTNCFFVLREYINCVKPSRRISN